MLNSNQPTFLWRPLYVIIFVSRKLLIGAGMGRAKGRKESSEIQKNLQYAWLPLVWGNSH